MPLHQKKVYSLKWAKFVYDNCKNLEPEVLTIFIQL